MSSSAAQIEANRANAQKSTGPKTEAGKAASSRNATSHGLSAKEIFVRPGEEADYLTLEGELLNLYSPQNEAEAVLQNEAINKGVADPLLDPELAPQADRILRHLRSAERSEWRRIH